MMGKLSRRHTLVLVLVLCTACDGHRAPVPSVGPSSPSAASATLTSASPQDTGSLTPPPAVELAPAGCTRGDVIQTVERFIAAFNQGDQGQLDRLFGARFVWYSVTEGDVQHGGSGFVAYGPKENGVVAAPPPAGSAVVVGTRDSLLPYFAARHTHGERLALRSFDGRYEALRNIYNFGYRLTREADDIPPGLGGPDHLADGKGAIDCADQTIMVWTMAQGDVNHQ